MLQAQLLMSALTALLVKKKRRWELSVHGPFVAFAALAVTQREGRC